jgi:hypothetical protein
MFLSPLGVPSCKWLWDLGKGRRSGYPWPGEAKSFLNFRLKFVEFRCGFVKCFSNSSNLFQIRRTRIQIFHFRIEYDKLFSSFTDSYRIGLFPVQTSQRNAERVRDAKGGTTEADSAVSFF